MNLQVGVKLLVKDAQGRYLFLRRSPSFKPGVQRWDIPGGRIEIEEPLDAALTREVREETGLKVKASSLIAAQYIFVPEKDIHVVRLTYVGEVEAGEPVLSDEHSEYRWMTKDDAMKEPLDKYLMEISDSF